MPTTRHQNAQPSAQDQSAPARLPGAWQAAAAAALAAVLAANWALPQRAAPPIAGAATPAALLDAVPDADLAAADATLDGSPASKLRARQADRTCGAHLAQLTLSAAEPGKPGRVRIQSGGAISPVFAVSGGPVRIAIPYPAPYAAGHGAIRLLVTGGDLMVALTPPLHAAAGAPPLPHPVRWSPDPRCTKAATP